MKILFYFLTALTVSCFITSCTEAMCTGHLHSMVDNLERDCPLEAEDGSRTILSATFDRLEREFTIQVGVPDSLFYTSLYNPPLLEQYASFARRIYFRSFTKVSQVDF